MGGYRRSMSPNVAALVEGDVRRKYCHRRRPNQSPDVVRNSGSGRSVAPMCALTEWLGFAGSADSS